MKKVRVTPAMAQEWLKNQVLNRTPSNAVVERYAKAMADGVWLCDPQVPLRFDSEGRLVDGQHRLLAASAFRAGVDFYITTSSPDLLDALHDCRARSLADRFVLMGSFSLEQSKIISSVGQAICERSIGSEWGQLGRRGLHSQAYRVDEVMSAFRWSEADPVAIAKETNQLYNLQPVKQRWFNRTIIGVLLCQNPPGIREFLNETIAEDFPDRRKSVRTMRMHFLNQDFTVPVRMAMAARAFNESTLGVIRVKDIEDLVGGVWSKK